MHYHHVVPWGRSTWSPVHKKQVTKGLSSIKHGGVWMECHWLVVEVSTPLKNMSESVGMINFPIYGNIKFMFQTTNQMECHLGNLKMEETTLGNSRLPRRTIGKKNWGQHMHVRQLPESRLCQSTVNYGKYLHF